ncbi:MAG: type II toxin-antitoxin system RelE/ParE family toxin [Rhizobiaceae bacterium]|nr:type II toxin-antitoxin system RelE/ParE family toxin [Rhizobiaceae bacterium]
MRIIFAPSARGDLREIGDYIAADNRPAAKRMVAALQERARRLVDAPRLGKLRPDLQPGLRSIPFRNYVILYRVEDAAIRIERIIHGARDIDAVFEDDA